MYYNMFKYTSTTIFSSTKVQQYLRVCTTICLNMYVQHNEYINTVCQECQNVYVNVYYSIMNFNTQEYKHSTKEHICTTFSIQTQILHYLL